jgi:hypothetical protein
MITPPACTSCGCLGTHEHSSITHEICSLTVVAKYFFIHPPRVVGYVTAPKPSRARRQSPESRNTWQHQSPPEQGGGVRSRRTRGNPGALQRRERGPEPQDAWQHQSPVERSIWVQYRGTRGSVWLHALLRVLAWSMYAGYRQWPSGPQERWQTCWWGEHLLSLRSPSRI